MICGVVAVAVDAAEVAASVDAAGDGGDATAAVAVAVAVLGGKVERVTVVALLLLSVCLDPKS
jgi:hypothetical protein